MTELESAAADSRKALQVLIRSRDQIEFVCDNMPIHRVHVGADDLRYSFVNELFEYDFSLPRDAVTEKRLREIVDDPRCELAREGIQVGRIWNSASYEEHAA